MSKPERVATFLPPDDPDLDREHITAREFEDGTRTAVRTLSSDFQVDVMFAGEAAATNGDRVILPANPPEKKLTHRQVHVGRGFANHESLHKLLTDFKAGKVKMADWKAHGQEMTHHLSQAIEDVRIEHGGTHLYPGMSKSIDKTASYVCRKFSEEHLVEEPELAGDVKKMLPLAVTWAGRLRLGYPSPEIKAAFDQLSDELKTKAERVVDAVMALPHGVTGVGQVDQAKAHKGSRDGMALAERIAAELAKEEEEKDPPEGDEPGEDDGEGGESGEGKDETRSGKGAGSDEGGAPFDPNLDSYVVEMMADMGEGGKEYKPFTRDEDVLLTQDDLVAHYMGGDPGRGISGYAYARHEISGSVATMRRKLERALVAKMDRDWETSRSGRLDVRRRSLEIVQGKDAVFKRRQDGQGINTAVSILVDLSGSMVGHKARLAMRAAIGLAEALETSGVPFEVVGFNTRSYSAKTRMLMEKERERRQAAGKRGNDLTFDREEACRHFGFKPFDKSLTRSKAAMGIIENCVGGNNADADSILFAASRLIKRPEPKKVLLTLSDGSPAWTGAYDVAGRDACSHWTRAATEKVREMGIQLVGIGIMDDSVKHFYPRHVVLDDVSDLGKAVLDQVAKMLLGERFHVDNSELVKTDVLAVRALGR